VSYHSCIYEGIVNHRRFAPVSHRFTFSTLMFYLDLEELPKIFQGRLFFGYERRTPIVFKRADYLGDEAVPLDEAVRGAVANKLGFRPEGPIRLLTQLRYFGYIFNPVSFYYCYGREGKRLEAILAEITNTPWGERYSYAVSAKAREGDDKSINPSPFRKQFHVSPFMEMEIDYRWRLQIPGERLTVSMENYRKGEKIFDANLSLRRQEMTGVNLAKAIALHPPMTLKTISTIYYQAFRLYFLKRTPFFPHPNYPDHPHKEELV
jgi:DUF1365 family protein